MKEKQGMGLAAITPFLKGSRRFFAVSLAASAFNIIFNAMTPQVVRLTVDHVIGGEPLNGPQFLAPVLDGLGNPENLARNLILAAVLVALFSVLSGLSNYLFRVNIAKGSEGFVKRMRDRLYEHIQRLPYQWHVAHQTGDIIQRCTSDVEVVMNFVSNQLIEVFRLAFLIAFAFVMMFSMNVKLSIVALVFLPIILGYSGIFYSKIAKRFRVADEAEGALSSTVQENLTGVRVVRAFGREAYEIERFDEKNNRFASLWIKLGYLLGTYWGFGDFFTGLQIMVIVLLGTVETIGGGLTLGEFLAFISYNSTMIWPIRSLGRILSEMSKAGVSIQRIQYILGAEEERDSPGALTPDMHGDIAFRHVNFAYGDSPEVLRDVDFTIPAGTTFAILGSTGSGKSTMMHLLDRLYDLPPECGSITVGGVDIGTMKRAWVRENIGMVLQEPFLFSRTIRENISAFRPQAELPDVRGAAEIACVDDSITEFPLGYETMVGERGVTLSGGQKQRVAIARMLMQQAPIMVFDDSLSAVDAETDSQIRAALRERQEGATVILVSHRITTLMQADQILVLEDGAIAEMGTHEELIAQEGIYKDIYDIQMSSDDRAAAGGQA